MSNHRAILLAVQYWTGSAWALLCGADTVTFTVTNALGQEELISCTDREDVIRTLQFYGAQGYAINYNGIWHSDAAGKIASEAARSQSYLNLRVFVPGDGYYAGDWAISQVEWQGGTTGALKHSAQLASHGEVTYTAV